MHQVFDTLQFRVLRDRLYADAQTAEPEADQGFDVDGRRSPGARQVAAWLDGAHRGGSAYGVARAAGTWGAGTGRLTGLALATADGAGAWFDPRRR